MAEPLDLGPLKSKIADDDEHTPHDDSWPGCTKGEAKALIAEVERLRLEPGRSSANQEDYSAALKVLPDSLGRSLAARIQLVLDNMRRESHIGCELRRELDGGIERDAKAIEDRWPDAAAYLRSHAHIEDGV